MRSLAVLSVHTSPLDQPGTGDGGGLNVYVLETGRRLARRGVEVDIYTRRTDPDQPEVVELAERLTVRHIEAGPVAAVDKSELPNHLCAFLLNLERHAATHGRRYDLVHAHYWLSGWVGRRLRTRWDVPLVQSFHTIGRVKNAALSPGDVPEPPVRLLAEARLVEESDRLIVSVCGEARDLHGAHGINGSRMTVVEPGVDLEVFHPAPARGLPDLPPGTGPLLLFVGRLQPLKAPDVALRSLALVRREVPGARLLIVGGPSGSGGDATGPARLRELARTLDVGDVVRILPAQPQKVLADLYRAADVLLVPSRAESFGLVALEAQASGTPVVAADVGGLRTVVAGGRLVAGHDPADHAREVIELLGDERERSRAIRDGLAKAAGNTWDATTDALRAVYSDLVEVQARSIGA